MIRRKHDDVVRDLPDHIVVTAYEIREDYIRDLTGFEPADAATCGNRFLGPPCGDCPSCLGAQAAHLIDQQYPFSYFLDKARKRHRWTLPTVTHG